MLTKLELIGAPHPRRFDVRRVMVANEDRRNIAAVLTLGLAIRAFLILSYRAVSESDSITYLALAHRLGSLHLAGYNAWRTPGYPLLLVAASYSPMAVWCVQAALGLVTTGLIYRLVRALGGSSKAALLASLLYTTSVLVLGAERDVLTETLDSFLVTTAGLIAIAMVTPGRPRRGAALLLGVTLSVCCLVRPDALFVALALSGSVLLIMHRERRRSDERRAPQREWILWPSLAMLLPPILALAAWAAVNRVETGVTTVTSVTGYNLIDHVAPYVKLEPDGNAGITAAFVYWRRRVESESGSYFNTANAAEPEMLRVSRLDVPHLSARLERIALGVIAKQPLQYAWVSVKYWPRFWRAPGFIRAFGGGVGSSVLDRLFRPERAAELLVSLLFVAMLAADVVRRVSRRGAVLRPPGLILVVAVLAGSLPVLLLGDGDESRHGYVFFPLILAVGFATGGRLVRSLWSTAKATRHQRD